jgi:hypothetical protein
MEIQLKLSQAKASSFITGYFKWPTGIKTIEEQ